MTKTNQLKKKSSVDIYLESGKRRGKKLNHYKMLQEICDLVETDFAADMEMHLIPNQKTGKAYPYTQKEAQEMADIISSVYSIAHCITCHACQVKYLK